MAMPRGLSTTLRRWWLPIVLGLYIPAVTITWNFPDSEGVPYPPVFGLTLAALLLAWTVLRGRPGPIVTGALVALTGMVLTDIAMLGTQPLRDFELYVKAGSRWLADAPVYMRLPLVVRPDDLSNYPFLYPPVTLPLFGALANLPYPVAAALWVAGSILALVLGFRLVGIRGRWIAVFLLWPPVAQGLYVGNVAAPLFLVFAGALWRGAWLVVLPIFKLYSGILGLWLLRREHLDELARGALILGALALISAPAVGIRPWQEWWVGLAQYQASLEHLPEFLYGFGLGRYLPDSLYALVGVVVIAALLATDRLQLLARLGVATAVASPSLFAHGLLVAIPALLRLDTPWLWLALGLTSVAPGPAWFVALGIAVAAWYAAPLRKAVGPDPWHPLGRHAEPWPSAVRERSG
jgi:hypothetical protein